MAGFQASWSFGWRGISSTAALSRGTRFSRLASERAAERAAETFCILGRRAWVFDARGARGAAGCTESYPATQSQMMVPLSFHGGHICETLWLILQMRHFFVS